MNLNMKKIALLSVIGFCLLLCVFFGYRLWTDVQPKTYKQQAMDCLKLGSDGRAIACLKLIKVKLTRSCSFTISDIKESIGMYGDTYYANFEGTITNTSKQQEHLKAMLGKFYTKNEILIQEGYTSIEQDIAPGKGVSFQINIQARSSELSKILSQSTRDIYPWFTTCR